jgi:hypothetical protein
MGNSRWLRQLTHWLIVVIVTAGLVGCSPSGSDVVDATPGADMSKIQVTISIDDAHLEQIDQVADQLKAAGLDVDQTMSTLGIVTGSVDSDKLSALSKVDGVDSVQKEKTINLPPPGSDVQ